jgi:hypothetical protein
MIYSPLAMPGRLLPGCSNRARYSVIGRLYRATPTWGAGGASARLRAGLIERAGVAVEAGFDGRCLLGASDLDASADGVALAYVELFERWAEASMACQ